MLYKDAGVDIDAASSLIKFIKQTAKIGEKPYPDFAHLIPKDKNSYWVLTTDGVGTKLKLAIETGKIEGIAQDLLAMCINDLLVLGGKPLYFMDYIATYSVKDSKLIKILQHLIELLSVYNIELIGGEIAELNDMLPKGIFDIAGFLIGITETKILKENVKPSDIIIGFPSSGLHSNGFSLVRKILPKLNVPIETLLRPTRIYIELLDLFKKGIVHSAAHITGGGIMENLKRSINTSTDAIIYKNHYPEMQVFKEIQKAGKIPENEMWRVFNMGIGFVIITSREYKAHILSETDGIVIGEIVKGSGEVRLL